MNSYYAERLGGERLRECYEIAPPRVRQYMEAEVQHVLERIGVQDKVLELGCGYGRVMATLAPRAASVVGIDNARSSLELARDILAPFANCRLGQMNAAALAFGDGVFDLVVCSQNGVSAFAVDRDRLIKESIRVTRPGGRVLFSSYAEGFWDDRLKWFRLQSEQGLLGEIDWTATGDGVIVCKDGFRATTVGPAEFASLTANIGCSRHIEEVDGSSVFCEIHV